MQFNNREINMTKQKHLKQVIFKNKLHIQNIEKLLNKVTHIGIFEKKKKTFKGKSQILIL